MERFFRCDRRVEKLPDSREGLLPFLRLFPQPIPVRPGDGFEELLVERIPVPGDPLDQLVEGDRGIVGGRPRSGHPGTHQDRPRKHRRRLEKALGLRRCIRIFRCRPQQQRIESRLPEDVAAEESTRIDAMRVPLPKQHARPLADRVHVVDRTRVDGQLVHPLRIEARFPKQFRVRFREQFQSRAENLRVSGRHDPDTPGKDGDRANFLVRVVVRLRPRLKHRDRSVPDVIVEKCDSRFGNRLGSSSTGAFRKNRLAAAGQKQGRQEKRVRLVREQIGVVLAVRRGSVGKCKGNDLLRLGEVAEGGGSGTFQFRSTRRQPFPGRRPRCRIPGRRQSCKNIRQALPELRVRSAVREIQVPEERGRFDPAGQVREQQVHRFGSGLGRPRPKSRHAGVLGRLRRSTPLFPIPRPGTMESLPGVVRTHPNTIFRSEKSLRR